MSDYQQFQEIRTQLNWNLKAIGSVAGLVTLSLTLIPLQLILVKIAPGQSARLPSLWHKIASRLIGLEVDVVGAPVRSGPVLFVSNHVSWLDIVTLGKTLKVSFIAKREVADWGVFGTLARLQQTVFIDRTRRAASKGQRSALKDRLLEGGSLVLFPEGTSTDGISVRPFKSALFSVAEMSFDGHENEPIIQPVTIRYTRINGIPLGRSQQPLVAWYGDMELTSHVWRLLGAGRVRATLVFHEPVPVGLHSRKDLAVMCHQKVMAGLAEARTRPRLIDRPA